MDRPAPSDRIEVARRLNAGGVSAAPLAGLAAISIYDDDEYENYDVDLIAPKRRRRIAALLEADGFRQTSGSRLESAEAGPTLVFPKPGILGNDPSRPAADLLARGDAVVLVTPTQALLLILHQAGEKDSPELARELSLLVWEQPANLDKVADWARAAGLGEFFARLRGPLEQAQAEGIDLRRRKEFQSRLPR